METRKVISLEKMEEKVVSSNNTNKVSYENNQRVCYPIGSTTKEIYPTKVEPKVAFPTGKNATEEVSPHQLKQESNNANQRVRYPEGSISEERFIKESVLQNSEEERVLVSYTDLNREYFNYEVTEDLQKPAVNGKNNVGIGCYTSTKKAVKAYLKVALPRILCMLLALFSVPVISKICEEMSNFMVYRQSIAVLELVSLLSTICLTFLFTIGLITRSLGAILDLFYISIPSVRSLFDKTRLSKVISEKARAITGLLNIQ